MMKKIVVVNAGPRRGWNTDTLITEAARGAESAGAKYIRGTDRSAGKRGDPAAEGLWQDGLGVDNV